MLKNKLSLDDKTIVTIGVLTIVLGISVLSYNYFSLKKDKVFEEINFTLFDNITDNPSNQVLPTIPDSNEGNSSNNENNDNNNNNDNNDNNGNSEVEKPKEEKPKPTYNYIGTLEIPKIDLKKGFVKKGSKYNDVKYNVQIIDASTYPDVDKGNFILAAHSGNSYIGYFNKLYKLKENDIAIVQYNKVKYTYKIVKIYTQPKTGKIAIYRDYDKTTLTLVTCTNTDSTTQTVYIAELISKE